MISSSTKYKVSWSATQCKTNHHLPNHHPGGETNPLGGPKDDGVDQEPLNGDYFHDVHLLNPGEADRRLLEPLYVTWN